MLDFCSLFAISLLSIICCICTCANCANSKNCNKCCIKKLCCDCPTSEVSNIPQPLIIIIEQPRLINNENCNENCNENNNENDLPKYDDIILYDGDRIIIEDGIIDELPPPEYLP